MRRVGNIFGLGLLAFLTFSPGLAMADESGRNYTHKLGQMEIILLPEADNEGSSSLLIGADDAALKQYLPDGTYPTATNAFLIRDGDKNILVDTGYGRNLFQNLEALGVRPEDISAVLLTHMHGDHVGGLLRNGQPAFPGAAVYIGEEEAAYWGSLDEMAKQPENRQGGFKNAQAVLSALGDSLRIFAPAPIDAAPQELLPGIYPIAAFGHTPGHTAFLLRSGDRQLLIWGDLTHAMAIQMPVPQVALTYDSDPKMAVATRVRLFKYLADNKTPVAGMHIPFSGMGSLAPQGQGYTFTYFK